MILTSFSFHSLLFFVSDVIFGLVIVVIVYVAARSFHSSRFAPDIFVIVKRLGGTGGTLAAIQLITVEREG